MKDPKKNSYLSSISNVQIDSLAHKLKDSQVSERKLLDQGSSLKIEDEWLTSEGAAEYLKISVGELRNKTSNGQIPYTKLGRSNRYLKSQLRELLLKKMKGVHYGN